MLTNFKLHLSEDSYTRYNIVDEQAKALPFQLTTGGHYLGLADYFTERNGLDSFLLLYTHSGRGHMTYLNQTFTLNKGQCMLLFCENYQFYKTISTEPWDLKYIHFNGTMAHIYHDIIQDITPVVTVSNAIALEESFDQLLALTPAKNFASSIHIAQILMNILSSLSLDVLMLDSTANNNICQRYAIERVIEYISENYQEKITIDQLAEIALLSRNHFARSFKRHMGFSPYEYLTRYRINQAKSLLFHSGLTICEIATQCGFSGVNSFIRSFKQATDVTPLQFRKLNGQMPE